MTAAVDISEVARLNVIAQRVLLRVIEGKLITPVVGFPLSGVAGKCAPFRVERERLEIALRGLPAGSWQVMLDCCCADEHDYWTLTIEATWRSAVSGRLCRSKSMIRPMRYGWELRDRLKKWAESQQLRRMAPTVEQPRRNRYEVKVKQCEEMIAKLQRQLTTDRPWDRCLKSRLSKPPALWQGHDNRDHGDGDYYRENQSTWHSEAYGRRKIAKVAGKYLTGSYTRSESAASRPRYSRTRSQVKWTELYADMAAIGCPISERNKFGRVGHLKNGPSEQQYLRELYKYAGLCDRNYCRVSSYDVEKKPVAERAAEHMKELRAVAVAMRERQGVLSEIENLEQLIIGYKELAAQLEVPDVVGN